MKCSQLLFGTVSIGVVVLLYLTTSAHCVPRTTKPTNYLKAGNKLDYDELLANETIREAKSKSGLKVSKVIRYPSELSGEEYYMITCVIVEDKGVGGYVRLKSGGPPHEFVTLQLESQEGKGFEFQVTIYGYKSNMRY